MSTQETTTAGNEELWAEYWKTRAQIGARTRRHGPEHPGTLAARERLAELRAVLYVDKDAVKRDYAAARLEHHVRQVVATAPPLTQEQVDRISGLLAGRP